MRKNAATIASSLLLAAVLAACQHPDYAIPLSDGYQLVKGNPQDIFISNEDGIVVGGKITKYAVIDSAIVGYAELPDWQSEEEWLSYGIVEGYFHINLINEKVILGMSWHEITEMLGDEIPMTDVK